MERDRGIVEPVRVLVVDDDAAFRRQLRTVLDSDGGITVVGEAGDGDEAIALAVELAPDVVLLDVRMPRRGGISTAAMVRQSVPATKIVMLRVPVRLDRA